MIDPSSRAADRPRAATWGYGAGILAGIWLVVFALVGDHGVPAELEQAVARVTAARELAPPADRSAAMKASDLASGLAAIVLCALALVRGRAWAVWGAAAVGLWLLFAPIVLWAPGASAYFNDSLVGAAILTAVLIVPGVPGAREHPGSEVPRGWNYNPSGWMQRLPIVGFALFGFFVSRYLAGYQLGHSAGVWDPFFGDGTRKVLDSSVSHAFPVSDAGLGAISYLLEALTGLLGGTRRWRTMPWMVLIFGVLVVPLGVVTVVLVLLQPLAVGAWCSLCLATAAAMLLMVAPALDEIVASCQFLLAEVRAGRSFWRALFRGGSGEPMAQPEPGAEGSPGFVAAIGLDNVPRTLPVLTALGLWLMAAPAVLGTRSSAAAVEQLVGALVVTFVVIAYDDIARASRWVALPLGLLLAASTFWTTGHTPFSLSTDVLCGLTIALLSLFRGPVKGRFGAWDRWVF